MQDFDIFITPIFQKRGAKYAVQMQNGESIYFLGEDGYWKETTAANYTAAIQQEGLHGFDKREAAEQAALNYIKELSQ